jgi:hypothetical protein
MIEKFDLLNISSLRLRVWKHKMSVTQAIYSYCHKKYEGHKHKNHRVGGNFNKQVKFTN